MMLSGSAPQSTGTNGPAARGLFRRIARATSSLPVPLSPWISTWLSLWRRLSMRAAQRAHLRRGADQLGQPGAPAQLVLELAIAAHQAPALERLAHRGAHPVDVVEGLGEVVEGAAPDAADRALDARVPRHHDHLDLGTLAPHAIEQIEPARCARERDRAARPRGRDPPGRAPPPPAPRRTRCGDHRRARMRRSERSSSGSSSTSNTSPGSSECAPPALRIGESHTGGRHGFPYRSRNRDA